MTSSRTRASTTRKSSGSTKTAKTMTKNAGKRPTKAPGKKAASTEPPSRRSASAPRAAARPRAKAADVARRAGEQLADLVNRPPGEVTQLERTDDGWSLHIEVLELRRIPDTMDMMALYEVDTDDDGSLEGYRRLRRYVRGVPGEE